MRPTGLALGFFGGWRGVGRVEEETCKRERYCEQGAPERDLDHPVSRPA